MVLKIKNNKNASKIKKQQRDLKKDCDNKTI